MLIGAASFGGEVGAAALGLAASGVGSCLPSSLHAAAAVPLLSARRQVGAETILISYPSTSRSSSFSQYVADQADFLCV